MSVSYKKLWKLLIDRDMKKKDLCVAAGISHTSMAKLGKMKCHNRCSGENLHSTSMRYW